MDRIEKLKEFLAATPNDAFLLHALALEYVKQERDDTAQELFEKLLQQDENYIGSYYHLGKLFERKEETDKAITTYKKGMLKAKEAGDNHAYNELQAAYEDLVY
jgi:Tfp pilus assembly protein PilF